MNYFIFNEMSLDVIPATKHDWADYITSPDRFIITDMVNKTKLTLRFVGHAARLFEIIISYENEYDKITTTYGYNAYDIAFNEFDRIYCEIMNNTTHH